MEGKQQLETKLFKINYSFEIRFVEATYMKLR